MKDEERWEKLLGRALLMRDAGKEGEGGEQEWAEGWEKDVEVCVSYVCVSLNI